MTALSHIPVCTIDTMDAYHDMIVKDQIASYHKLNKNLFASFFIFLTT